MQHCVNVFMSVNVFVILKCLASRSHIYRGSFTSIGTIYNVYNVYNVFSL